MATDADERIGRIVIARQPSRHWRQVPCPWSPSQRRCTVTALSPRVNSMEPLPLRPIGFVRSPLKTAVGSPLQPRAAAGVQGTIELDPELAPALQDLAGFSRVWVLYWFHRATPAKLVIKPYRDDHEHGLFATRVPARPNPIGLSTVALLGVNGATLTVGDLDILDGTPVLDVKPYVPEYDAYPSERSGWLESASRLAVKTGDARFQLASGGPLPSTSGDAVAGVDAGVGRARNEPDERASGGSTAAIDFWEKPGCAGNAKQQALLVGAGQKLRVHNLLDGSLSAEELRSFFGRKPVHEWFNLSAPAVKSREVDPYSQTEESALRLMLESPILIRRPLMIVNGIRLVGFELERLEAILGPLSPSGEAPRGLDGCIHPAGQDHGPCPPKPRPVGS